jgi:hypothetical protein
VLPIDAPSRFKTLSIKNAQWLKMLIVKSSERPFLIGLQARLVGQYIFKIKQNVCLTVVGVESMSEFLHILHRSPDDF